MQQTPLDLEAVRRLFPAFAEPSLEGWSHFEAAGGSYASRFTLERLTRFYRARKIQPFLPYPAAEAAGAEMEASHHRLAALMGVPDEGLVIGPSTSQNTHVLANAFRRHLPQGAAIIVTDQDHEANSGVWRRLESEGFEIRKWHVDRETGLLDPARLAPLLEGAALLAFPHCSNIVGAINPAAEICAMARKAGVRTVVDGVSYAPHGLPAPREIGADIYLFSTYKTFGPHQGVMWIEPDLLTALPVEGHYFNAVFPGKRLVPAGPDHAQVAALGGIVDHYEQIAAIHGIPRSDPFAMRAAVNAIFRAHETALLAPLLEYLAAHPRARLIGPASPEGRAPTVAILHRKPGEALAAELAEYGIMAGGGDFYAVRLLEALGIDPAHGVLRLSFVHYAGPDDIEKLIAALEAVL